MKKFQLLVMVAAAFYVNLLYANPAGKVDCVKEINNKTNLTGCLLTTYDGGKFNDHSTNSLNSQNTLVYNCAAKILPTISFTSVNNLNLLNDKDAIPYPDVSLTIEDLPEYKNTVVATVIF